MHALKLRPGQHRVAETRLGRYLERATGSPVFTYFHTGTRNWVVARWLSKGGGTCLELACGPIHPDSWPRSEVEAILLSLSPLQLRAMKLLREKLKSESRTELRALQDENDEDISWREFWRSRATTSNQDDPRWVAV